MKKVKPTPDSKPLFFKEHSYYCGLCMKNTPCEHFIVIDKEFVERLRDSIVFGENDPYRVEKIKKLFEMFINDHIGEI